MSAPTPQNQQQVAKTEKKEVSLFDKAKGFLSKDDLKKQIAVALPKHLTPDRMLRVALTAVMSSPKLQECFNTIVGQASIAKSLLTASQLGLEVDGRQGHLVPFWDNKQKPPAMTCQFIPGYQGLIGLSYNHPMVKAVWGEPVYEKDHFVEKKGSERVLIHEPYVGDDEPGPLIAAYAVCQMDNGAKTWVVMRKRDIDRIKASSRSTSSDYSPWKTSEAAMWVKSAIRQLSKFMPQANELRTALEIDDEVEKISDEERFAAAKPVFGDAQIFTGEPAKEPAQTSSEPSGPTDEQAEAAAGLAPVKEAVKEPPKEKARSDEIRAELNKTLADAGFTYPQMQAWAIEMNFYPGADSFPSIDDLPLVTVRKLVNSKVGLLAQLAARFPKEAK